MTWLQQNINCCTRTYVCVIQCTHPARAHAYAALHNASASDLLYLPVSFQFTSFSCACSLHLHAWKRLNGLTNSSESHTNLSLFPTGLPERDAYPSLHNLTTASCLRPNSFNKSLTPAYDHNTLFTGHSKLNVSAFLAQVPYWRPRRARTACMKMYVRTHSKSRRISTQAFHSFKHASQSRRFFPISGYPNVRKRCVVLWQCTLLITAKLNENQCNRFVTRFQCMQRFARPFQTLRPFGCCWASLFFFSSSLAVDALWHGPDNDISSEKSSTQRNWPVPVKKANHHIQQHNPNQDDPQIPQPDLRFVSKAAKQQDERGQAQQKTHTNDLPYDTVTRVTVSNSKTCKNMQRTN